MRETGERGPQSVRESVRELLDQPGHQRPEPRELPLGHASRVGEDRPQEFDRGTGRGGVEFLQGVDASGVGGRGQHLFPYPGSEERRELLGPAPHIRERRLAPAAGTRVAGLPDPFAAPAPVQLVECARDPSGPPRQLPCPAQQEPPAVAGAETVGHSDIVGYGDAVGYGETVGHGEAVWHGGVGPRGVIRGRRRLRARRVQPRRRQRRTPRQVRRRHPCQEPRLRHRIRQLAHRATGAVLHRREHPGPGRRRQDVETGAQGRQSVEEGPVGEGLDALEERVHGLARLQQRTGGEQCAAQERGEIGPEFGSHRTVDAGSEPGTELRRLPQPQQHPGGSRGAPDQRRTVLVQAGEGVREPEPAARAVHPGGEVHQSAGVGGVRGTGQPVERADTGGAQLLVRRLHPLLLPRGGQPGHMSGADPAQQVESGEEFGQGAGRGQQFRDFREALEASPGRAQRAASSNPASTWAAVGPPSRRCAARRRASTPPAACSSVTP